MEAVSKTVVGGVADVVMHRPWVRSAGAVAAALALAGCMATSPTMGDSRAKTVATGATAGSTAENANSEMERCSESLGTVALVEDQGSSWYSEMRSHRLQSTIPVLRMLVQQSNCFVVVERGQAMHNMRQERGLQDSGELREGSNFAKGQMVAADYTMSPSVTFSQKDTGGLGGLVGGRVGTVAALVGGQMKFNEASTMLTLIDNRSGVQLAAAEGSSRNTDFGLLAGAFRGTAVGASAYGNTPQGKVVIAAFADSYNQMVRAVRNYRAQEVRGGLGTGGRLGVQGGTTPASKNR
ncbi:CsgG/HfaB family protein [Caldimonas brevitalea]|uniref:Peptidoglycan-binding protein n=1 Tax=Caldimonas brevitalea TaxID=413882 RepID=A0A0G3BSZ0_9BURK|nr:CsgG/HfaB family protein [Caldimonas brevitalea]AKJ30491.1 peptidoglycan-binding protein [Caldimonas brevitalea]